MNNSKKLMTAPASITDTSVALLWDREEGEKIYRIYQDGILIAQTEKTDFTVEGLLAEKGYCFKVESCNEKQHLLSESQQICVKTQPEGPVYDITKYGAVGDGRTSNTKVIQGCIDACPAGGTVYVPEGIFVTGALFLKSNMRLYLERGSKLLGSLDLDEYPMIRGRYEEKTAHYFASLITVGSMEADTENVTICGQGTIDANGNQLMRLELDSGRGDRGRAVHAFRTRNLYLKDVIMRQSPAWCFHFIYCENVSLNHIQVHTKYDENGKRYEDIYNGDGIDPDASRNVCIFNSLVDSQDDCIAIKSGKNEPGRRTGIPTENVRITNCLFRSGFGIAVGSEVSGGIRNVWVEDCIFENTFSIATVKPPRGRGNVVEDIVYKNCSLKDDSLELEDCEWFRGALQIDEFYSHVEFDPDKPEMVDEGTPTVRRITFENITVDTLVTTVLYLVGLPERPVEDITVRNVSGIGKRAIFVKNIKGLNMDHVELSDRIMPEKTV